MFSLIQKKTRISSNQISHGTWHKKKSLPLHHLNLLVDKKLQICLSVIQIEFSFFFSILICISIIWNLIFNLYILKAQQIIEEELINVLPIVSELNSISEELNKYRLFEVVLVPSAIIDERSKTQK
jgi:hypothetical protein